MFTRKAMTIMTTRMAKNTEAKAHTKAYDDARDFELTSPAFGNANSLYANLGGVVLPIK